MVPLTFSTSFNYAFPPLTNQIHRKPGIWTGVMEIKPEVTQTGHLKDKMEVMFTLFFIAKGNAERQSLVLNDHIVLVHSGSQNT